VAQVPRARHDGSSGKAGNAALLVARSCGSGTCRTAGQGVGSGVLQSADVRRRAAVRVGHQLAPALEVAAAQKVVDRGLDHHEENAEVEGVNHQAAVLPPVPFLHSQPNNQLRLESLAISPHLSIKANLQHH
jgi:hypothetical protein